MHRSSSTAVNEQWNIQWRQHNKKMKTIDRSIRTRANKHITRLLLFIIVTNCNCCLEYIFIHMRIEWSGEENEFYFCWLHHTRHFMPKNNKHDWYPEDIDSTRHRLGMYENMCAILIDSSLKLNWSRRWTAYPWKFNCNYEEFVKRSE